MNELPTTGSSSYARVRNFLDGTRLYQLLVIVPEGKQSVQNIQVFMNSFKLTSSAQPASTVAPAATTAVAATNFGGVLDNAQEIEPDPAVVKASKEDVPDVQNLIVKMYVSADNADRLSGALDSTLIKSGFKFSLPGQTRLTKIGANSYGGFYSAANQPDLLIGATALSSDFDQRVKNLDELSIPGLEQADLKNCSASFPVRIEDLGCSSGPQKQYQLLMLHDNGRTVALKHTNRKKLNKVAEALNQTLLAQGKMPDSGSYKAK